MSLENTTSNNNKLLLAHYPFPTYMVTNRITVMKRSVLKIQENLIIRL
jgi:hypothetical protein